MSSSKAKSAAATTTKQVKPAKQNSQKNNTEKKKVAAKTGLKIPVIDVPKDEQDPRYVVSFTVDDNETEIVKFFNEYGFIVFRDVLTQQECDATVSELWDSLEREGKFNRNDIETWTSTWPQNAMEKYGSTDRVPFFTTQFLKNRENAKIFKATSILFGTTDLLVNHDRGCLFRPTKQVFFPKSNTFRDMPQWNTEHNVHLDMNPLVYLFHGQHCKADRERIPYERKNEWIQENNKICKEDGLEIQATINLMDNQEEDGGFVCVPGFHKIFEKYFTEKYGSSAATADLENLTAGYNFAKTDPIFQLAVRIPMRAGSVVIWQQTMPHGSAPNRSDKLRCAQFFRIFPASQVSNERALKRAKAVARWLPNNYKPTPIGEQVFGLKLLKPATSSSNITTTSSSNTEASSTTISPQ